MVSAPFGRRALLVAVLSLTPASVLAQGASTATIAGVVRDPSGGVLPGVTIEAASPALIEKVRSTVTDDRGQYRLPELRPGLYTVTFSLAGFSTLKRDGLELRTNFTAQVDVELNVSQLEETITVSGATPLVDVQSATQQRTVSRELLDTVPTAKGVLGIAALIPAVVEPPNAQDVGGSKGERSVRITVHGGKTFDSRLLQDGMRYNALTPGIGSLEGTGRGYYVNPLAVEEVVVDLGTMGSAEYSLGGAQVNSIPRTGGNRFTGSFFVAGTGDALQSNNLDDDLIAQGLTSVNSVKKVYDFNASFGGPVISDRLWFFASARRWGTTTGVANLFGDSSVADFIYSPDTGHQIEPDESNKGIGGRLTYQATAKDKLTFSWDKQRNFQDQLTGQLETGTIKNEANAGYCQRHEVLQGSWSRPQSNALLFDAGVTVSKFNFGGFGEDLFLSDYEGCGGGIQDNVSINDTGLGFTYNGVGNRTMSLSHQSNGRFNLSIIKGQHTMKTGVFWMYGLGGGHRTYTTRGPTQVNGLPVSYTFFNGAPRSLTQFASPSYTVDQLNPDLGLYVQDQWRISRVTISAGLRFDWLRESVKATEVPAGMLVPARSFPARTDVPNWKDLNPRFAVVWDPTGSGKTAIKFGINRYVQSNTTGLAQLFDQAAGAVNSTTRSWNDQTFPVGDPRRSNFLPDCNLVATTANGECGAMANPNFGTYVPVNSPDPDWITGWGKRNYNWQTSINVDREVIPNVVVNAGIPRVVRQLHGDRQPEGDARRLQPLLRDGAGGRSVADERPAALRALRHQSRRVRSGGQPDHAQRCVRQAGGDLQRRRCQFPGAPARQGHARRRLEHRQRRATGYLRGRQRLVRDRHLLRDRFAAAVVQLQGGRAVSEPGEAQWLVYLPVRPPGGRRFPEQPGRELRRQPYLHARRDPAVAGAAALGWSHGGRHSALGTALGLRATHQSV